MKISQEEIDAANYALGELMEAPLDEAVMEHALISALKVRRARKASKRERQRKEKDKQVVESVKDRQMRKISEAAANAFAEKLKSCVSDRTISLADVKPLADAIDAMSTPSKAPEWDGTFGVGEWETRGGIMATVIKINDNNKYPLSGNRGTSGLNCWWNAQGVSFLTKYRGFDLIRPWPKGEQ